MRNLTVAEQAIIDILGDAADAHANLPAIVAVSPDIVDFESAIRAAQNIVFARPAFAVEMEVA